MNIFRETKREHFIPSLYFATFVCLCSAVACSDASLYHQTKPPLEADRVTIEGRVCTENPEQSRFPVRLIMMVDQAQGSLYSTYDPGQLRLQMLNGLIQTALSKPEYELAIFGYAGRNFKLAPEEGLFTRNPGVLMNAVSRLSLPEGCIGDSLCRDYQSSFEALNALIEDDLASMEPGRRSVTQYTVLWVAAGQQEPLALNRDCCPQGDRTCERAEGSERESARCQAQLDLSLVQKIRNSTLEAGGGGFQLHILHLASEEQQINQQMSQLFEQLTFAGNGRYARFGAASGIDPRAVSVFDRPSDIEAAQILVINQSAAPRLGGLLADSDQDGLADEEEDLNGNGQVDKGESDPLLKDSDGDGISDLIEAKVGFSIDDFDQPVVCDDLYMFEGLAESDRDFDGLNECEERLMGTVPSLSDSDGDSMPDGLEVMRGTDHLNPDSAEDFDEDGISNGDEMKEGTDPRSIDESQRLGLAARYTVEREGRSRELEADTLTRFEGIQIIKVSSDLTAGLGALQWEPSSAEEELGFLSFKTPSGYEFGAPTPITKSGKYRLYGDVSDTNESDTTAENTESLLTDEEDESSQLWIEIEVNQNLLPNLTFVEDFLIRQRERSCLSFKARNVRLVETQVLEKDQRLGREIGVNDILVYLSQKPVRQSEVPGRFRVARVPIYYRAPDRREPSGTTLLVEDAEFVSPRIEESSTYLGE